MVVDQHLWHQFNLRALVLPQTILCLVDLNPITMIMEKIQLIVVWRLVGQVSNTTRSMRQQDMNEAYQISKQKELDMLWASFFYEANMAFNVVRHPTFIKAVNSTANIGFDYNPPSYHAMRTTHIKARWKEVQAKIDERTKTICADNVSNMLGAIDDILEEYSHMYKQGCCAHILDDLLEDWGKE